MPENDPRLLSDSGRDMGVVLHKGRGIKNSYFNLIIDQKSQILFISENTKHIKWGCGRGVVYCGGVVI